MNRNVYAKISGSGEYTPASGINGTGELAGAADIVNGANVTTYEDIRLSQAITYYSRRRAYNGGSNSAYSSVANPDAVKYRNPPANRTLSQIQIPTLKKIWKKRLTSSKQIRYLTFCDRSGVACSSAWTQVSFSFFGAATSSIDRTVLPCSSAVDCSLVCERTGPCYDWAVFAGDDLAIHSSPCSAIANRQGALVATI